MDVQTAVAVTLWLTGLHGHVYVDATTRPDAGVGVEVRHEELPFVGVIVEGRAGPDGPAIVVGAKLSLLGW